MTFEAQKAGLSDVFGGQMWFCLKNGIGNSVVYFWSKKTWRNTSERIFRAS